MGYTKSSPVQTKLRYLKIAAKLDINLLQQILLFAKDYRLRKRSMTEDFDFASIEKSWVKILNNGKIRYQSNICYQRILEVLLERERHIEAIEFEKMREIHRKIVKTKKQNQLLPLTRKIGITCYHIPQIAWCISSIIGCMSLNAIKPSTKAIIIGRNLTPSYPRIPKNI